MNRYSIRDLEKIAGIKAHTIRMWEKRYNIISPKRTPTNIRYYCDDDLKKLMNISTLNRYGIKISEIVEMSEAKMSEKIIEIGSTVGTTDSYFNDLIISTVELNESLFSKIFSSMVLKFGIEKTFTSIIFPFLEKIGIMWQAGTINPAQEHFVSNHIRQKLLVSIDNIEYSTESSSPFMLFLPEREQHELSLLLYYYLLKKDGNKVVYLGQSVPFNDLKKINNIHDSKYMLTIFTTGITKNQFDNYLKQLNKKFPDIKIFVSGLQVREHEPELPANMFAIKDYNDIIALIG